MTVNDECKLSLAPIGRARNALPSGNGGGSRNPGKRVEIAWSLAGHGVPDTVENGLCSRI